jgi:DNA-binding transcriptional MerR regulator
MASTRVAPEAADDGGNGGAEADGGAEELSLDELAERTGVTPRTIRYYQSQHVLPKPRHVGRDARYSAEHLVRLQVIAALQERGLKLEAIKRLVGRDGEHARSVTDFLGLDEVLRNRWVDEQPSTMTLAEVHNLLGRRPRRLVGELVDSGVLERLDDGRFVAVSPALLDLMLRLIDAGVTVDVARRADTLLRKRLAKAAEDLVDLFLRETGTSFAGQGRPEEVAAALASVRPIALDASALILAQEMERALQKLAASTKLNRR